MNEEAKMAVKKIANKILAKDLLNRVRRSKLFPQYLQREIYQDVYHYLVTNHG